MLSVDPDQIKFFAGHKFFHQYELSKGSWRIVVKTNKQPRYGIIGCILFDRKLGGRLNYSQLYLRGAFHFITQWFRAEDGNEECPVSWKARWLDSHGQGRSLPSLHSLMPFQMIKL